MKSEDGHDEVVFLENLEITFAYAPWFCIVSGRVPDIHDILIYTLIYICHIMYVIWRLVGF
ncbi:hypothetical protein A4A49_53102 [Nicotiana attenuata]|uniref:Uncharacterized protein n=1 Tax=Nicotiana attenuata TaxID=49451 RepID=A0A1J6K4A1_NICAT|nr:hypothetical protein A4A49_53102 [Nicotiana attenuata]